MERGRVVLVPFQYSDLVGTKRRPACVVSTAGHNDHSPDIVVAMITSSRARADRPESGDVVMGDWQAAGLPLPSVVRSGRLLVLEHRLLGRTFGDLSERDILAVNRSLRTVLGLS